MLGMEKSAFIGPNVRSHSTPSTTSTPSMGKGYKGIVNRESWIEILTDGHEP